MKWVYSHNHAKGTPARCIFSLLTHTRYAGTKVPAYLVFLLRKQYADATIKVSYFCL